MLRLSNLKDIIRVYDFVLENKNIIIPVNDLRIRDLKIKERCERFEFIFEGISRFPCKTKKYQVQLNLNLIFWQVF